MVASIGIQLRRTQTTALASAYDTNAFSRFHRLLFKLSDSPLFGRCKRFPHALNANTAWRQPPLSIFLFSTSTSTGRKVLFCVFHSFPQAFFTLLWKTAAFSTSSTHNFTTLWKTQIFPHNIQKVFHNVET